MRVTASKVGLLESCQAFARPEMEWSDRTSEAAERGTRFHKAIAEWTLGRVPVPVEDDIAAEIGHATVWVDALEAGPEHLRVEIALAWDPESDAAEILGTDRDYTHANGRLCGTADLVMLTIVGGAPIAATVWDWKTGSGLGAGPQLRALGLMVSRAFGIEQVTVAALEATAHGVFEVAREDLDAFELAGIAGQLAENLAAIPTAEPTPGSHCGELYCPSRLFCPLGQAATADIVQIIPVSQLVYRLTDPIATPEHAAWALDVIRLVGARLEAIKDGIKDKVPAEGWALDDGRVLRETTATMPAFDKHKALALCKQLGATPEQIGGLSYTFQKSNGLRVSGGKSKPRPRKSKAA